MPPTSKGNNISRPGQGLLLPAHASRVALGRIVEVDGVQFIAHNKVLTPEEAEAKARLDAEKDTLDAFALINQGRGYKQHNTNQKDRIENDYDFPEDEEDKDKDELLAEHETLIEGSTESLEGLGLRAKGSFAKSIGIEAATALIDKLNDQNEILRDKYHNSIKKPVIHAKDPDEQVRLDEEYNAYCRQYLGVRNRDNLVARRNAINIAIEAIVAPAAQ